MDPDDKDKLIPCECDGLDYEIDYFELKDEKHRVQKRRVGDYNSG